MRISSSMEITDFCLEGRLLNFVIKDGYKLKGLLLATSEGQYYIKLAKHLRVAFDLRLPHGAWLQVVGRKKYDAKKDELTLKAEWVMATSADMVLKPKPEAAKKQTILFCKKSDCMKSGGKAVCQMLEKEVSDRGLENKVNIKGTGCMKNCKAGPNLVMPDKTRYSGIQAGQVPAVIDKHLGKNVETEVPQFVKV
ncbi:(2Fe-2S) ferredoxin domain-containing protein [Trichormus azollae]|uniref:(2Fe-2S) ferredoxin domain-containing protein n=1 Tax=Trichormus azollae TaxID=1164 RepID=UPI00325F249A